MGKLDPVTPGELLLEEFLKPMGLSQYRLAKEIGVPAQRISEIISGKRSITADTDLRLCKFFGLSNGYWLRAQVAHDTEVAERRMGNLLSKIRSYTDVMAQNDTSADRDSRGG
ncbi:MAG: HigA family addiction module antitoxin [Desulfatiglandales bacterium]